MSLVATAAVAMLFRFSVDLHRTRLILNDEQINLASQGATLWAIDTLNTNWKNKNPNKLTDIIPIHSKTDEVNGIEIESAIYDMQSSFNLNNLATKDSQTSFLKLLSIVDPELGQEKATQISLALQDWISASDKSQHFDADYAGQHPPYRAPHHLMASVTELRLVNGITPTLYNKLLPFVTALSANTKININNAPAEVICSLNPSLTLTAAKEIVRERKTTPFVSEQKFLDLDIIKNTNSNYADKITVTSNFFLLKTMLSSGQQHLILYTLLRRNTKDNKSTLSTLWQTKGTM